MSEVFGGEAVYLAFQVAQELIHLSDGEPAVRLGDVGLIKRMKHPFTCGVNIAEVDAVAA
jgi:hypothetical protein